MIIKKFILTVIILSIAKNIFSQNEINIFENENYVVKENIKTRIKKTKTKLFTCTCWYRR